MTILIVDGVGAYDHVQRPAMLGEAAFDASGTIIVAFRPHVVCPAVIVSMHKARHVQ